jgi:hypothetical protein
MLGDKKQEGKRESEMARRLFAQGAICLAGHALWKFNGCYVQLMADLRVSL